MELSGGFTGNWQTKKSKFILTLLQGLASFYPDMHTQDGEVISDPVGVFLKPSFTMGNLEQL